MHSEKNKSVVRDLVLCVTTQTSSSWREGVRELHSNMSLLMLQSTATCTKPRDFEEEKGTTCLS